jgi:hypothetical protein
MSLTMKQVKKKHCSIYWLGRGLKLCSLLAFLCGVITLAFGTTSRGLEAGLGIFVGSFLFIGIVIGDRRFWKRMHPLENSLQQLKQENIELEADVQPLREEPRPKRNPAGGSAVSVLCSPVLHNSSRNNTEPGLLVEAIKVHTLYFRNTGVTSKKVNLDFRGTTMKTV